MFRFRKKEGRDVSRPSWRFSDQKAYWAGLAGGVAGFWAG